MHELTDGSVEKLARLIGDEERARLKIQRLRSLADVIESDVQDEAKIFKALSDPCRLAILKLLQNGEFCVCEIMIALDRPQSTTSHHLSILKDAGLIKERKVGKWSNYRLADGAVIEIMNQARLLSRLQK